MKYTWQNPSWPQFTYDKSQCQHTLYQYALEAGRLAGGMGQLKESLQYEAYIDLMVSEAIHTSQIEGENINREDVRSSIKKCWVLLLQRRELPIQGLKALPHL